MGRIHFIIIIVCFGSLSASTGKISGKITDSETSKPMIGVNILVKDIGTGSVSDIDGEYTISNIPPGTYTIEATYIGYSKIVLQNILVSQNRTSYQDFSLTPETIEGKEVVVIADRPMIHRDLTA